MQYVRDSYTDTTGTDLNAHTPEVGGSASRNGAFPSNSAVITAAGRLRPGAASATAVYNYAATPATADYSVQADAVSISGTALTEFLGVVLRSSTNAETFYCFLWGGSTAGGVGWELSIINVGSRTVFTSTSSPAWSNGATHTMLLTVSGTSLTATLDGSQLLTHSDSTITNIGTAGIFVFTVGTADDTHGTHLDNFSAFDGRVAPGILKHIHRRRWKPPYFR